MSENTAHAFEYKFTAYYLDVLDDDFDFLDKRTDGGGATWPPTDPAIDRSRFVRLLKVPDDPL